MCGFLGEFSVTNKITSQKEFAKLLQLSKHRGPDSTEIIQQENFQLGFNRLSILDLSANGNQPKISPSGRYAMVFNGEIYNYQQLQKEHCLTGLQSSSDTEVLIHLLDKLGIKETVLQLNGMFAIAIIDKQTNTLSLTRDFAGIKPLFYGKSANGYVFASQFNQVFKHPWHRDNLQLRPDTVKEYFGFGYMQAPNTVYKNISQVSPGTLLEFSANGEKQIPIKQFSSNLEEAEITQNASKSYTNVLKCVVKNQLVSDVPIATFLSGGIDSPLITALAKESKNDMEAFTFGIDHPKYDESKKASEYAKHIKVKQILHQVNESDLLQIIDEHFKFYPEPFGDYSSIPTFAITKEARKKYTVMLSGDGGDELFFGYPRMLDVLNKKHWFAIPFKLRKPLLKVANKLHLTKTWAPYYYKNLEEWITAKQLQIFPDKLDKILPNASFSSEMKELFALPKNRTSKNVLHWLRFNEFYGHMQRVLIKVDRASMGNSLEVRVPFLDIQSIDFSWKNTPVELENHSQLKQVLKQSLAQFYPKELIETKKKGFSVPIEDWLKDELKEDVFEYVFNKPFYGKEFINVEQIKKQVSRFYESENVGAWGIWHIYAWQKWAYHHVI